MAKVSLRIYDREIESFIEQGNTNEAIAHCHHILRTFSKHLATYRLLGKAYLESKRYGDAVDVFGRVLMSVPDDFVAHVGMSIICDEENKLDDAIWHMQRAFESQPSNSAIQGELQRLYGRRDGMEPPKIRMTRGALAQMYVQGELYPQAIAEIRAVLSQEPDRADLQVLLARAYFRGGQKANASDMCAQLLKRYQYCFDANRIMVDLLPATVGTAENTQVYRMRVGEMDPYATFSKGSIFQSDEVADAAINLERLEYMEEEIQMGQEWGASLGLASDSSSAPMLAATSSDQPDWLKSGGFSDSQSDFLASSQIASVPDAMDTSQPENNIPDFLREAGWGESNSPEQPTSIFDTETAGGDLTPADIPDWLKGQIPSNISQPDKPESASAQAMETPDWLSGIGGIQADGSLDSIQPASAETTVTPDWLNGLGDSQTPETELSQSSNGPESLTELGRSQASEPAQPGNVPDWLTRLGDAQPEPAQPKTVTENLGSSAEEQDDAVAWLESLAAKHGAKPEELVTDPNKRSETPPEWVSQAQSLGQQVPAPSVESLGSTAQDQDDAVAWLESLAAKHGAKPEELVSDPNKRFDNPPEWVSQAQSIGEAQAASASKTEAESPNSHPAVDETGMWLRGLEEKEKQDEFFTKPASDTTGIPDWLSNLEQPDEVTQQESATQKSDLPAWVGDVEKDSVVQDAVVNQVVPQNDLSNWLSGLDDEPGLPFDELPTPDSILISSKPAKPSGQEPVKPRPDLPDWLSDVDSAGEEPENEWKKSAAQEPVIPASNWTEEAVPVNLTENLPDWLQSIDEEESAKTIVDPAPWVHREVFEEKETQLPKPTSPSDWRPVEPKEQPMSPSVEEETTVPFEARQPFGSPTEPKPSVERQVETRALAKKKSGLPAKQRQLEGQSVTVALNQAKGELDRGDIPAALDHYKKLIKKGRHLEETIRDLTESIYRYPVEVGIWQTLGDAYMRANRLKEALEAYNKAEELIR